jgi:hypothetical protein
MKPRSTSTTNQRAFPGAASGPIFMALDMGRLSSVAAQKCLMPTFQLTVCGTKPLIRLRGRRCSTRAAPLTGTIRRVSVAHPKNPAMFSRPGICLVTRQQSDDRTVPPTYRPHPDRRNTHRPRTDKRPEPRKQLRSTTNTPKQGTATASKCRRHGNTESEKAARWCSQESVRGRASLRARWWGLARHGTNLRLV